MALSATNRINSASADNHGTGAYTSGSFTPTANSRLVIIGYAIEESADSIEGGSITAADSTGLTLTAIGATTTSPGWGYGIRAWVSDPVGATPASRTIALDCGATNVHAYRLWVDDITGVDAATPITGFIAGSDADGNGAASLTLSATPVAADMVYGAAAMGISSGAGGVTPGATFAELFEASSAGWAVWEAERATGVTSTTVDWVDLNSGAGTMLGGTLLAFIVKNAAGGGSTPRRARLRRGV